MQQTKRRAARSASIVRITAVISCALLLVACKSTKQITGSYPDDYRLRHPITLQQSARVIDIPVGIHSVKLTPSSQSAISAFAREFKIENATAVQIMVPAGAKNEASAHKMAREVRLHLLRDGLHEGQIDTVAYTATDAEDAPIRLAYPRVVATSPACEVHPDTRLQAIKNVSSYNFGCASQQNFAAMVANPEDLIQPRGWEPRDSMRRTTVTEHYRSGEPTWSEALGSEVGTSSGVSK
ncbi:CpaD family pilus assembly protein [uncultured Cohaesibacter sp.]|uniref:CpaD family pilus assembly protein n=1 Tax=uncultured Cohaesibacter sp. TaxID=1002546 RepID=UPI002930E9D0|nr:CpaD family pilus assembly protein [uncultured Cohaesibacter sp.]